MLDAIEIDIDNPETPRNPESSLRRRSIGVNTSPANSPIKVNIEEKKESVLRKNCCIGLFNYFHTSKKLYNIVMDLDDLDDEYKSIITKRYISVLIHAENKYFFLKIIYFIMSYINTVGAVFISALLLIGKIDTLGSNVIETIFWITFALSIIVNIANKTIEIFSMHKKYTMNYLYVERLKIEGWRFVSLTDMYSRFKRHNDAFQIFSKRIERLAMKNINQILEIDSNDEYTASPFH